MEDLIVVHGADLSELGTDSVFFVTRPYVPCLRVPSGPVTRMLLVEPG